MRQRAPKGSFNPRHAALCAVSIGRILPFVEVRGLSACVAGLLPSDELMMIALASVRADRDCMCKHERVGVRAPRDELLGRHPSHVLEVLLPVPYPYRTGVTMSVQACSTGT